MDFLFILSYANMRIRSGRPRLSEKEAAGRCRQCVNGLMTIEREALLTTLFLPILIDYAFAWASFILRPDLLALSWFRERHYLSSLALRFQEGPLAHGVTLHDPMTL